MVVMEIRKKTKRMLIVSAELVYLNTLANYCALRAIHN